jgi:TusA-related sulfurtransferase
MRNGTKTTIRPIRCVDVSDTRCPTTDVRVRVALDMIDPGRAIEFVLAEGEQMQEVPRGLKQEGHQILTVTRSGGRYHLIVRKGGPGRPASAGPCCPGGLCGPDGGGTPAKDPTASTKPRTGRAGRKGPSHDSRPES